MAKNLDPPSLKFHIHTDNSIASDELAASSSAAASEAVPNQYTQPEFLMTSPLVTTIVRRELAVAIRDLMQHGMIPVITYNLLVLDITH